MTNPEVIVASVLGLLACIGMGMLVATGILPLIALVVMGALGITIGLVLKEKIWMLIPFTYYLSGSIRLSAIPFSINELAILSVMGMFLLFFALKVPLRKPKFDYMDFWMLLMLFYLLTVFIRNPVGVRMLGSSLIGGKPYYALIVVVMAWFCLRRVRISANFAKNLPIILASTGLLAGALAILTHYVPSTVPIVGIFYSKISTETYVADSVDFGGRATVFGDVVSPIVLLAIAYWQPITMISPMYPFRILTLLGIYWGVFTSGFRNVFALVSLYLFAGQYFHNGFRHLTTLFFAIVLGVTSLNVLILLGVGLPPQLSRTLSFLPGNWDAEMKRSGQDSTEWRVQMWKDVLTEPQYIRNKIFGDGFGFTSREFELTTLAQEQGPGVFGGDQGEMFKISANYHSGPVSTVKIFGYFGGVFWYIFIIALAWYAFRLIQKTRGTPFFYASLYMGIPLVIFPLFFTFIFGSLQQELPLMILRFAILKLIKDSFDDWQLANFRQVEDIKKEEALTYAT